MKSQDHASSKDFFAEILRRHDFIESHYKLIGHTVVEFGAIEMILSSFVATVINQNNFLPALLALNRLSLAYVIDIARAVFPLQEEEMTVKAAFESILKTIDELRVKRNSLIHSFWTYNVDDQRMGYMRILPDKKKKIQIKDTSYTLQEFKELNSAVASSCSQLLKFVNNWEKRKRLNFNLHPHSSNKQRISTRIRSKQKKN